MNAYSEPNKERILAVFRHELPDRVPNFEVLVDNPTVHHVLGRDVRGGHTLANIDPEDYLEFAQRIGQDVIGLCFYDSPFRYHADDGSVRKLDFRIRSHADWQRVFVADLAHQAQNLALMDRYVQAVQGTSVGLFVLLGSFFTDAYNSIFGFDNFMCLLFDDRDLIEEVVEQHAAYYVTMVERLVQYPLTFLYIGDDLAYKKGTLIRPELMRELWVPRMRRLFAPALERDIPILFHSDGNIECLIPDLLEMGIAALNPIEPYGMDIREIKRRYGQRLALVGNLDVGGALSRGTPAQVRAEAEELIDDVGRDGGLVLASSHSITPNVQPANFLAMVDTAQTYGVY
jgi:uroporphyrinogen decarboxylase